MDHQEVPDAWRERCDRMINAWPENRINVYANTMNMLLWCIKGLGVLIITWTTVVLLGGFVSLLQKEDFWCLTAITLVQLAGAFNIFLSKTIKAFWASFSESMICNLAHSRNKNQFKEIFEDINDLSLAWKVIVFIFWGICMVFSLIISLAFFVILLIILSPIIVLIIVPIIVILSPFIAIYIFGMCISTAISVWRLWENDYGNADDGANFRPALIVLYSMVVLQGLVFGLTGLYYCAWRKKVVRHVEDDYLISHQSNLVTNYLRETVAGCQKDRAFLEGRNLVTYAVDQLMKPAVRPEIYISGLRSIISYSERSGRQVRLKELLVESSSYSHIIHKLLRILHPKSHYSTDVSRQENKGTKEDAARIVAFLADEINLEDFPPAIQCISSLLDTFEVKEYPRLLKEAMEACGEQVVLADEAAETFDNLIQIQAYKNLVLQGLCILAGLADSEDNCRVIGNTSYLLSRITAPLVSIRLHREHHDVWSSLAEESLIIMCKLMAAFDGETADKLRCHISSDGNKIVSTLQSILQCTECEGKAVQQVAMEILLDLSSVDTGSIIMASGSGSSRPFIVILLRVFLQIYSTSSEIKLLHKMCTSMHWMKKRSYMRNLAGNMLASLSSQSGGIATAILRVCVSLSVLGNLADTFVNARDNTHRIRAAQILEHLCVGRYTEDDEDLIKKALLDAMPKVLKELLGYGTTREGIQAATGNVTSYSAQGSDLEEGRSLHDNSRRNKFSPCWENSEQHGNGELKEALLSLCVIVGNKFISTDPDQARRFDGIASKFGSQLGKPIKTFSSLMEEAQEILTKDKAKQLATAADNFSSGG